MIKVELVSPDGLVKEAFDMADGMTLNQAVLTLHPDGGGKFPVPTLALVGATPAVRELGDYDFPLSGCHIQFRQLAAGGGGGGGSNTMQIVMQVAIIALAAAATWYIGGSGTYLGITALEFGSLAGAMAGTAVMVLGTLLMGALFNQAALPQGQIGASNAAQASPTYSINASGNTARLYQQEPEVFGRMKVIPDYAAKTWTYFENNEQIAYFVYALGRGRYEVESLQFGETTFWKNGHFTDVSGYVDETGPSYSVNTNQELAAGAGYGAPICAVANDSQARTIIATFSFPAGLAAYQCGAESSHSATVRVQAREIDNQGNPLSDWADKGATTWTEATTEPFSRQVVLKLSWGRWEVRACNEGRALNDGRARERVVLSNVSSVGASACLQFVEPGQSVTLFPDNVVTSDEVSAQELFAPNEEGFTGAIGPYAANPPGTVTDRLLLDFVFQSGLGWYDDRGNLCAFTVNWLIEYRAIDDFGAPVSGWATLEACSRTQATLTPQRITLSYSVAPGRYEVRVRRTSDTRGDGRTMDSAKWGALRAMLPGTYAYPVSCIALRIKASNALSQAASNKFSAIITRKLPHFDRQSRTWGEENPTRSWAAAVSHVLRCAWGGRLADRNIDLDALWNIGEQLEQRGWHYDACIDGPYLIWTLISEMCQSQCVIPRLVGPLISFVQDAPDRAPSFALTPRSIVRGSFAVTYHTFTDDTPDDVTLEYLDAAYGFQQRDVTASLPESESREPANLSILGITNREHAFRVATLYAAHNRWRRVSVECQVEALGRIVSRGDVCTVAHPRFRDTLSGKVIAWDADRLALELKADMTKLPGFAEETDTALYLALVRPDGSVWGPCRLAHWTAEAAQFDHKDYSTLLLQGHGSPFEWLTNGSQGQPTAWTLSKASDCQRLMIVEQVSAQDPLHYTLKLRNYTPKSWQYAGLPVPFWQGRGQLPQADNLAAPGSFRVRIQASTRIVLSWLSVSGAQGYDVETSADGQTWNMRGRSVVTQMTVDVPAGIVYARVRATTESALGAWSFWQGDTTIPAPSKPAPCLEGAYRGGQAVIVWTPVAYAESYFLALSVRGDAFYVSSLGHDVSRFTVTPELFRDAPARSFRVTLSAQGAAGKSEDAMLDITDPAPSVVTSVETTVSEDAVIFQAISPQDATDATGFALVRGNAPDFTVQGARELRETESLPFIWGGLPSGRHYFRAAIKDAFYDATANPLELMWSDVVQIDIPAGGSNVNE